MSIHRRTKVYKLAEYRPAASNPKENDNAPHGQTFSGGIGDNAVRKAMDSLPLVGREKEIKRVRNLILEDEVRLVTLAGVGGAGKTRLAQAVADELRESFAGGAFFVELAALTDQELVLPTIAQTLGIKEGGGRTTLEVLKDFLREKQMLLVLDNFEQVIEAAPHIAELHRAAGNLFFLVTSRIPLHLSAETEFIVPPLAVPEKAARIPLAELSKYAAIELFIKRARIIKPNFKLSDENAGTIAEICARLDGLPLAIELAAARIKILAPRMLLAKLENRLNILTGGASDLPARQQTMRGTIKWSFDLLSDDEKLLFRRLAVFAGGFTFEAAESVVSRQLSAIRGENENAGSEKNIESNQQISSADVLDLMTSLVNKSLLTTREQAGDEHRFRMLETVREFALEALKASGESDVVRRCHAEYFYDLAVEAEPFLQLSQSAEWLARLEYEHDNLRVALRFAAEFNDRLGQGIIGSLWRFWWLLGYIGEGCEYLAVFLSKPDAADKQTRLKMLLGAGFLNRLRGNFDLTRTYAAEALKLARETGEQKSGAFALYLLGLLALDDGEFRRAENLFKKGKTYAEASGDKQILALLLNGLGEFSRLREDYARAANFYRQALIINREIGDVVRQTTNLINLGATALSQNDLAAAGEFYREGLQISSQMADTNGTLYCLEGVAGTFWMQRNPKIAAELFGAASALREIYNLLIEPPDRPLYDRSIALVRQSLNDEKFNDFSVKGRRLNLEEAVALCLENCEGGENADYQIFSETAANDAPAAVIPPPDYHLTEQERRILKMIVEGHHYKTAARELGISKSTVSFHLNNIYEKLQVHSKTEAVAKALREQII